MKGLSLIFGGVLLPETLTKKMVQKINPRLKRIRWIGRFGTVLLFMGGLTASQPLKMAQHLSSHGAFSVGEELVFGIGWKAASAGTATLKIPEERQRHQRPAY